MSEEIARDAAKAAAAGKSPAQLPALPIPTAWEEMELLEQRLHKELNCNDKATTTKAAPQPPPRPTLPKPVAKPAAVAPKPLIDTGLDVVRRALQEHAPTMPSQHVNSILAAQPRPPPTTTTASSAAPSRTMSRSGSSTSHKSSSSSTTSEPQQHFTIAFGRRIPCPSPTSSRGPSPAPSARARAMAYRPPSKSQPVSRASSRNASRAPSPSITPARGFASASSSNAPSRTSSPGRQLRRDLRIFEQAQREAAAKRAAQLKNAKKTSAIVKGDIRSLVADDPAPPPPPAVQPPTRRRPLVGASLRPRPRRSSLTRRFLQRLRLPVRRRRRPRWRRRWWRPLS